ncbi:MAG: dihydropteroate synthase [Euryarchaeota archaeon]|jgi:dihydropteroate synthase|nr:dihydropteroate synthase [Euryarchaeota archaeon]MBT4802328.1 dihydropteroate synthase [Euryarchaeota archaeon]MBT5614095.1 dihydropteroate synthase [Euryarchaeota archaeon]MBT6683505.1 dihydropteroate synthase [Euryarchaeota archaeon]MBT6874387.1 dihydropteroate synthase [Euryarchaeota archaeon]
MADWRPITKSRKNGFPRIMGIINVTPDSFFKNSRLNNIDLIVERAIHMADNGADWIDIGGESTRPGAGFVSPETELLRISKAIEYVRDALPDIGISIDTRKSIVAKEAIINGADMINDVSGLSDSEMKSIVLENKCPICIMHMKGLPRDMQNNPSYKNVIKDVNYFFESKNRELAEFGINSKYIINDPGIGFGKLLEHNLQLLSAGREILPNKDISLMWGVSRKKLFADLLGRDENIDRLAGTLGVAAMAPSKEVDIIRVHDVAEHNDLYLSMGAIK